MLPLYDLINNHYNNHSTTSIMDYHQKYIVDGYVAVIFSNTFGGWFNEEYGSDFEEGKISSADYKIIKYNKMFSGELSKALIKKKRMEDEADKDQSLKKDKKHVFKLKSQYRKIRKIIKKIDPYSHGGAGGGIDVVFIKDGEEICINNYDGHECFQLKSDTKWISVTANAPVKNADSAAANTVEKGFKSTRVLSLYNSSEDYLDFFSKIRADESESEYEEIIREPTEPMILIDKNIIETIDPKNSTRVCEFEMELIKYYFNIKWLEFSREDDRVVVTKNTSWQLCAKWNKMITVENLVIMIHELQGNPKYGFIEEEIIVKFHEYMEGNFGDVNRNTHVMCRYIMDRYFNLDKCHYKLDDIFKDHGDHNDFNITVGLVHELQRCNYDSDLDFESDSD